MHAMSARQLQKSIGFVFVLILVPKPCERCQIFPLRAEESNCKLLSVCKLHETIVMPLQRCPAICSPLRESLFVVEQTSALCFRVCQYIAQQSRLVRLNPGSRYPVIGSSPGIRGLLRAYEWADFPDFYRFSDFLGRLQPSKTTIQKTPDALIVAFA